MSQTMEFSLISFMAAITILLLFGDNVNCQVDIIVNFYAQQVKGRPQIIEGDTVLFSCQVSNEFNDISDSLFINNLTSEGFVQLATETDASIEWANNILAFTKDDISRFDAGDYQCVAASGLTVVQQFTITMNVLFPALDQPVCETLPGLADPTLYDGDEITLRCSSDAGNPILHLQWSNDRSVDIPNANNTHQISPNNVMSEITVTLNSTHNGVIFTCSRDNPSFPSNQEFCNIGPLTVKDERPTTLAQTISSETIIPQTAASWTTAAAMTMESKPATSTDGISVIVAIVAVLIIVIGIAIIIVIFLVRSGRCTSILKANKDDSPRKENVSLEAGHNNDKIVVADHSHDNPAVDVNHVLSPNGGQLYAVVQKNTPARETSASGDTSIVYPAAPEYPRPEKTLQSDGDLYANAGIAHEASGESPDNPSGNSAARKDTADISFEKSNDGDASGMALYANPSDIATGDSADASLIGTMRKQEDTEMALYANASEVIPDNSHMPAPSEAPPAPPTMAHTPGLEYADIDIARPASLGADGRVDIISNEDQVLYASVK